MGGGICLSINKLQNIKFDSHAVATGCSLGVDSFSTIEKYTSSDCLESYRLTHLTFFNAGSYGSRNLDKARDSYNHDLEKVKEFGQEIGLPVVEVETNFALLYKDFPNYGDSGFLRNMSVILSMQKLFKNYLYASTYQANDFSHSWANYFYLVAKMLSTQNTDISISLPIQTRTDKTQMIINNPLTYKYLNVCWGYLAVDRGDMEREKIKNIYINCCRCDKCLRTLLTIDILGYKDKYSTIFDVNEYDRVKNKYLGKIIGLKDKTQFSKEISILMQKQHTHIPFQAKLYSLGYKLGLDKLLSRIRN